jgi:hypothetical protein
LICVPGRLAFVEAEDDRYLLDTTATAQYGRRRRSEGALTRTPERGT